MVKVIEKTEDICPHCNEIKVLEICEGDAKALIKDVEVSYKQVYTHCTHCKEDWYSASQLKETLANGRVASEN